MRLLYYEHYMMPDIGHNVLVFINKYTLIYKNTLWPMSGII
jgi:hypothetical protein